MISPANEKVTRASSTLNCGVGILPAGDSFAGGLIGYLAKTDDVSEQNIRKGIIYGSVVASFCAEEFGLKYLENIKNTDIKERYEFVKKIRRF